MLNMKVTAVDELLRRMRFRILSPRSIAGQATALRSTLSSVRIEYLYRDGNLEGLITGAAILVKETLNAAAQRQTEVAQASRARAVPAAGPRAHHQTRAETRLPSLRAGRRLSGHSTPPRKESDT